MSVHKEAISNSYTVFRYISHELVFIPSDQILSLLNPIQLDRQSELDSFLTSFAYVTNEGYLITLTPVFC